MFEELFGQSKILIGVIHLPALPGCANHCCDMQSILEKVEREADTFLQAGYNGIIIENYYDLPFEKDQVDPSVVSSMSVIAQTIQQKFDTVLGINVLRNDAKSAVAIAKTTGADFIRVNILTGAMVTDSGIIEAAGPTLLPYREKVKARDIKIFADVMVKHAYPIGNDINIVDMAKETVERGLADVLIVSGIATGAPPDVDQVRQIKKALPDIPVIIGSGLNFNNAREILSVADGAIVASSIKTGLGQDSFVDKEKAKKMIEIANEIRGKKREAIH